MHMDIIIENATGEIMNIIIASKNIKMIRRAVGMGGLTSNIQFSYEAVSYEQIMLIGK